MVARRGTSRLGCLVTLLLVVAVVYFGFNVGEVYLRYFRLRDAIEQEARFAHNRTDDSIRVRIAALVDSLGLPDEAARLNIVRNANRIVISSDYTETVEFPLFVRVLHFAPHAVRTF